MTQEPIVIHKEWVDKKTTEDLVRELDETADPEKNYWLDLDIVPFDPIQRYIKTTFDVLLKNDYPDAKGIEWWYRKQEPGQSQPLHYDKDENLHEHNTMVVHPLLCTITYLDSTAIPTIFALNGETIVYPKTGQFVWFDSTIAHEVISGDELRRTLCFNVWNYKPESLTEFTSREQTQSYS